MHINHGITPRWPCSQQQDMICIIITIICNIIKHSSMGTTNSHTHTQSAKVVQGQEPSRFKLSNLHTHTVSNTQHTHTHTHTHTRNPPRYSQAAQHLQKQKTTSLSTAQHILGQGSTYGKASYTLLTRLNFFIGFSHFLSQEQTIISTEREGTWGF